MHLAARSRRHDEIDASADRFRRGISEQAFRGRIPAGDRAVERFGYDGVVGGFDGGAEKTLARRVMVARGLGPAMFLDLALQRVGLGVRLVQHPRERPCQHAGLAARIDRNGDRIVAADSFDGRRELADRPGQRPRNDHGQCGRAQHRDQPDQQRSILDGGCRCHETAFGTVSITAIHSLPARMAGAMPLRPAVRFDPVRCARHLARSRSTMPELESRSASRLGVPSCEPNSRAGSG